MNVSNAPEYTYDVENFKENFFGEFTWLNGFLRNVSRFGDKPALYDSFSNRSWTYRETNAEANKLGAAFLRDEARKNDVVMYMLFNSPEFAFSYLATHKTGTISCPINFRLSPGEIALQLEDSKPTIFIFGEEFAETARKALKLSKHKPGRVVIAGDNPADGEISYKKYTEGEPETNPETPFAQDALRETTRLYTSGTTNLAKAVPLNSLNEVLSSHDVMMHFPLSATDRTLNMTPWFHRGGLHSGGLAPTWYAGGEVVILREFNPRKCLELAERKKVTFLIGVPSIIALLARAQEYSPANLENLKGIVTMGSPFDKSACDYYQKLFTPNIFNGYGTTETFWNTFLRPYNLPERAGSAGQSCVDDEARVVRIGKPGERSEPDDMVARDNSEIGEIIVKAPGKSSYCYVNNPEKTAEKFYKGYHYTGDLGVWDKDAFITVISRKDDMIISSGENIYPTQIEAILNEHPGVAECAVVGKPDKRHGEIVIAYIVASDENLDEKQLKEWCATRPMLPTFKRPRQYKFMKALPHTATGKILHRELRELARKEAEAENSR